MRPLDYRNVVYWYDLALLWRLENFLSRHNLSNQFAAEDHQRITLKEGARNAARMVARMWRLYSPERF
jgi:hypothetical protein